jgi:predicted RND superfamily exporter protein
MEVEENDNETLKRLFLKRFGRALPEVEVDVDLNMDLIDLTEEDNDEMEVATSEVVQVVVKTEPIDNRRHSSRLERLGKALRKSEVIPEKEAPLAAGTSVIAENVIADTDADMAEDVSVNAVGSVNPVESVNTESVNTESGNTKMTYEQTMAAIDAAIADD